MDLQLTGAQWVMVTALTLLFLVIFAACRIRGHPLYRFPGPWLAKVSQVHHCWRIVGGRHCYNVLDMHNKYGPVVRTAPNELSFNTPQAWQDINVHRKGRQDLLKSQWYGSAEVVAETASLVSERDPEKHDKTRKYFTHAFSDRGLRESQDLIMEVVDLFIARLKSKAQDKDVVQLEGWFNILTFDIVGKMAFGETFGGVESGTAPPWILTTQKILQNIAMVEIMVYRYPFIGKIAGILFARQMKGIIAEGAIHEKNSLELIRKRIAKGTTRPDLMSKMIESREDDAVSDERIAALASDLVIAGSETTSMVCSVTAYYLDRNPACAAKLRAELDAAFTNDSQINATTTARLEYLTAICKEAMRIFPPAVFMQYRVVPHGGATIDGYYVPEGTHVSSAHLAASCSEANFHKPFEFIPERWLDKDNKDNLSASNPFSLGPRACIGRSMAWMEMRIILAKIYFTFDIELLDKEMDWHRDSKMYLIWQRRELNAKLHLRNQG